MRRKNLNRGTIVENNLKDTIEKGKENIKQAKIEYKEKQTLKKKRKFVLKIFRSVIAILVLVLLILVVKHFVTQKSDDTTTDASYTSKPQIIDVSDIAKLQVANITYNSVATIDKDGNLTQGKIEDKDINKKVSYYVAYEGVIEVDFDLKRTEIKKDDKNKKYIVSIPNPKLTPIVLNEDFQHIFIDSKAEEKYSPTKTKSECEKDLNLKLNKERTVIEEQSKSNLKSILDSYLNPLIEDEYQLEYEFYEVEE